MSAVATVQTISIVPLEPLTVDTLVTAPTESRRAQLRCWLEATFVAARQATQNRVDQLSMVTRENAALSKEIGNLRECVNTLRQTNTELQDQYGKLLERLERAELIKAIRQEPNRPWWKPW
ncbi:MAG: hypothetical protein HY692_00355 [Cyanobacteria bacterium NC_groundwater_1444_Ag_S-0.65um_54_12]|nr:hypothetical protein [Cyanobacteria bacterium NC_groundwater_1444_Ag_S-0.65um_54_12]